MTRFDAYATTTTLASTMLGVTASLCLGSESGGRQIGEVDGEEEEDEGNGGATVGHQDVGSHHH